MWPQRAMEELERPAEIFSLCLLQLCGTLGFAKLIKDKFLQNFQHFPFLVFAKCCKKAFFFFLFIFVARLPVTERAKAAWKHKCNRGTICQLFSTMPGITGIESKGFKYYQLWWFIPLQGLLASFAPKHFMLCPVLSPLWALASERAWIVCINSSANVELQPLLISSFSVLSLNYSLVCNLALHSLPFSVVNLY